MKTGEVKFFQKREFKILIGVGLVLAALILAVWIGILIPFQMFSLNPRFTLKKISLDAHPRGYWKGKNELICDILKIKPGSDNLFSFNLRDLNRRLSAEPSIESVEIARKIPDVLSVRIREREPRVVLRDMNSPYVADENGILMMRNRCMDITGSLPVVVGLENRMMRPGMKLRRLAAPLEMVMLTKTLWSSIVIDKIIIRDRRLLCAVRYKNLPGAFRVTMPVEGIPRKMRELATALEKIASGAKPQRDIDLRFDNQTVLRELPAH